MEGPNKFTPNEIIHSEIDIIEKKEYKLNYNYTTIILVIERRNNNIIIRSSYYQIKFNAYELSQLTGLIFNSLEEAFLLLKNIFENNNYYIKEITSSIINIIIRIFDNIRGTAKDLELTLKENLEDKNSLIKELFNRYNNMENEINLLKNNNAILMEENKK